MNRRAMSLVCLVSASVMSACSASPDDSSRGEGSNDGTGATPSGGGTSSSTSSSGGGIGGGTTNSDAGSPGVPSADAGDGADHSGWRGANSGLAWKTGFANGDRAQEAAQLESDEMNYLHRETDVFASFLTHDTMSATTTWMQTTKKANWTQLSAAHVQIVQVVPLVFQEDAQVVDQIVTPGPKQQTYIAFWKDLGSTLAAAGAKAPVLRLGHEMNLGDGFPWSAHLPTMTPAYFVTLYKLAADAIQSTKPDVIRCWNPGKHTNVGTTDEYWPGDGYVDVVGVDWYDNGSAGVPLVESAAIWNAHYMDSDSSGPIGVGAWYAYARAHGKPIAFPEWALTDKTFSEPDRPAFIQAMHDFFATAAAAGHMAFESYYNPVDTHQLYPQTSYFAASSKLYVQIFQPGQ